MAARIHKGVFTKVKIARELLKEKAEEIFLEYMDVIAKAKDSGQYEVAAKQLQWLIDHIPADEDGNRIIEQSVDKKQLIADTMDRPSVQIGIVIGGTKKQEPKALPVAKVVDADTE